MAITSYIEDRTGSAIKTIGVTDDDPPRYIQLVEDTGALHVTSATFNLNHAAGVLDLLTATGGDVWVEISQVFVKTAAASLTSLHIDSNHATDPKSIVASIARAAVTTDLIMTVVVPNFVLPSGKKIQGTIVGTGSGGSIILVVKWFPITAGATLA